MTKPTQKIRAPRNRTATLSGAEQILYGSRLLKLASAADPELLENRTINQDLFDIKDWLPSGFADLIFIDPPYNLTKSFNGNEFRERTLEQYKTWLDSWLPSVVRTLKPNGSLYICGDWRSSSAVHEIAAKHLKIQNRITWEREKGRGSIRNWKNCSEDIWFCTKSDEYVFNVEAVKVRRRVIAPYRNDDGSPKDWDRGEVGDYRMTHPSNLWTDLTVPFWSMSENTDHPTQKPEKLLAKIILASSRENDLVFDPFLGSGTTSVTAKKLGRRYLGIEVEEVYCCLAEKRLFAAEADISIQGYSEGFFWERNSFPDQRTHGGKNSASLPSALLPFAGPQSNGQ
jgi:site-specific DNA-methyltransferase (adenine-specific)